MTVCRSGPSTIFRPQGNTPWDGKLVLDVTNVADKGRVLDPFAPTGRPFDYNLLDGYGRVRYTQSF